jgi:hypothetical protein
MLGEHASAGKFRAFPHQLDQRGLAVCADEGHIRQIDYQSPVLKLFPGRLPSVFHLLSPRTNQPAFQYQNSPAAIFDDGDLEHFVSTSASHYSNGRAKVKTHERIAQNIEMDGREQELQAEVSRNVEADFDT